MKNRPHIPVNDNPASADGSAMPRRRTLARRGPAPMALEPRVMFDGATADAALAVAASAAGADAIVRDTSAQRTGEATDKYVPAAVQAPAPASARHEIVFIGDSIANYAQLVAGIRAGVEVIVLDHTRDGMQQIIDALHGREPVDAVHLVTHGAGGMIDFGSERISTANLALYGDKLAQIGQALGADADLLIYGCDVAQGTNGAMLIDQLAQLTGADVAASTNITGSAAFGGDFVLETSSGALETTPLALDSAGWEGQMAVSIYNANWQTLNFDGTKIEAVKTGSNGTRDGDIVRFKNVITIDGVSVDAVVTTRLDRTTITAFDSLTQPTPPVPEYFQPNLDVISAGGGATFIVDFQVNGQSVTLQNVVVNSYDIDGYSSSAPDRQYQEFRGFAKYQLGKTTKLVASAKSDGSVTFQYTAASGVNSTDLKADDYRVKVFYDSITSFQIKTGVNATGSGTFQGIAYFALDFSQGPGWVNGFNEVETPAASLSYSASNFTEAAANDGSITMTSTITLKSNSFTGVFSGSNNAVLAGVTFSNVPAGLTAEVVRVSDTTAILRLTGKATAHGSANSVDNMRISFSDAAFTGDADAIPNATRSDIKVTFIDPPADTTAPIVPAGQTIIYAENRPANTVIGTVAATDNVAVTGFRFADTLGATSSGGHFTIDSSGRITMTAIGAASVLNDAESVSSIAYHIQARDAAGNWSASQEITLGLSNVDDSAPTFSSGSSATVAENQNQLYVAHAVDDTEFTNKIVSYALQGGDASMLDINASSGAVTLKTGNLDFETKSSYTFTVLASDASGNQSSRTVTVNVSDVDERAPAFSSAGTASAAENQALLYTAQANDLIEFTDKSVTYSLKAGVGDVHDLSIDATTGEVTLKSGNLDFESKSSYTFTVIAKDATGNASERAVAIAVTDVDEVPPTVVIESSDSKLKAGQTATLTFTFSEPVGSSFTLADISVDSGSVSNLVSIGGNRYTAIYTPAPGTLDAAVSISVAAGKFTDLVANANTAPASISLAVDTQRPVVTGPGDATGPHSTKSVPENSTAVHQFTASEAVSWSLSGEDAAKFQIDANGNLSFRTAPDYETPSDTITSGLNTYLVNVIARDINDNETTQAVQVTVIDVNELPQAADASISTDEDVPVTGKLPAASDADGDDVGYAVGTAPSNGTVIVNQDGAYTYSPNANFNGADSFSYTISDGKGGSNTYTINVTVTPVNDVPAAGSQNLTTVEDTGISFTLPGGTDVDGDPLGYAQADAPQHGSVTLNGDGSYTYTPAADYHGTDSFSYTISDGKGGSNTYTINVTVTPVDDAPLLNIAPIEVGQGEQVGIGSAYLNAQDIDTAAANLVFTVTSAPAKGQLMIGDAVVSSFTQQDILDNKLVYQADVFGSAQVDAFTVSVSDGTSTTVAKTVDIAIRASNIAPTSADRAVTTLEDTPYVFRLGDFAFADANPSDTLAQVEVFAPATGKLQLEGGDGSWSEVGASVLVTADDIAAGKLQFVPVPDASGSPYAGFDYKVVDPSGAASATARMTVNVTPVNDAPVASGIAITTSEDTQAAGKLPVATDADQDAVSYARASNPSHGTVEIKADGSYTYTPVADYNGADSFSYTVSDGKGGSNTYTVEVAVTPVNDAPVASGTTIATNENMPQSGKLPAAVDVDQDPVSYATASGPSHGTVEVKADGSYTYTPASGYNGDDSFSYTVSDGKGGSNTYTVSVTVSPVNDAPVASNATITTGEDTPASGKLPVATDADQDPVTYATASAPSHGTVEIKADGSYTYTPVADYNGADSFSYTVSDGKGGSNTYTVEVAVTPVNDAPVASGTTIATNENMPQSGKLPAALDADQDPVSYATASNPSHGTVEIEADGSYTYAPAPGYHGADSFSYTVSDGKGGSNTYTVSVTVGPVNDAPVGSNTAIATSEDTPQSGKLPAALDADQDQVSYATASNPSHGTVEIKADGSYLYTPAPGYNGADSFSYTVSDGKGGSNTYTVEVTVAPVNDAPVAANSALSTPEDTPVSGSLPRALDADGDAVTYAGASAPAHGTVSILADGSYTYTPVANYNGADSFSYTVSDGKGGSNTYAVDVTVVPVNDAPEAHGGASGTGTLGEPMTPVQVPAFTDIDSPVLSYSATLADGSPLPAWLVFDPATLGFSGTPPAGSVGGYAVTVTASDGALSVSTPVSITVANPPAPMQSASISSMTRDTGVSASDFITADGGANRTVTGSLSAPLGRNEVVQVSYDGGASWTTATVAGSSWSAIDNGAHGANWTIEARVTNTLSGLSGAATVRSVTLDTSVPAAPTVDRVVTSSPAPVVTGTAVLAPGEKLQVTIGGATYDVTPQNGSWTLDLSTATPASGTPARLEPGLSYDVVVAVTDLSGNVARDASTGDVSVAVPVVPREVLVPPAPPATPEAAAPAAPAAPEVAAASGVPAALPFLPVTDSVAPGSMVGNDTLSLGTVFGGGRASEDAFTLQFQRAAELSDVYTRSDGFRTVVAPADEPALVLFQGVPDQYIETGARLSVTVPSDAFAHTQPKAVVRLAATMQDGSPLPGWVQFNGQTGQFSGQVPEGMKGELRIKLTARDQTGREATALFRLNVGQAKAVGGKAGLTDLLRQTGTADARQAQLASIARPGK